MYSYKFSDKQSQEIQEKANSYETLQKLFEQVDKKYNFQQEVNEQDYNKKLNLERKQVPVISQQEIEKQAQAELHQLKASEQAALENQMQLKQNNLEESLENLQQTTKDAKSNLQHTLEKAKQDASDDAIKRGLARSSIIVNKLASYDQTYLNEFAKIEKNFLETQNKLTNQKSLLEVQRQNALDAFDIAYAVKLNEKINKINEEFLKQEKQVIEYNNKLEEIEKEFELKQTEKLAKAKLDAAKQNQDYAKLLASGGVMQIENAKQQEKFDIALDYLSTLPKAQALYELENNSYFKNHLKTQYQALVSQTMARNN